MKTVILSILLIFNQTFSFSQDDFNYLFPVQPNISRFEARKIINQINNILVYNGPANLCYWYAIDYLKNDSTYYCNQKFNFITNKFFNSYENECTLLFSDDKLYRIIYELKYKPTELQTVLKDFDSLKKIIASKFPNLSIQKISGKNIDGGKEQIGEGAEYSIKAEEDEDYRKNGIKFHKYRNVNISYSYQYKLITDYTSFPPKYTRTGEIENYVINIEYVDLRNVKYDTRGY